MRGILLDGTRVHTRRRVVLVVEDEASRRPLSWGFGERETYRSWLRLLAGLQCAGVAPGFAVCDGHKGLLKALRAIWPEILIQRCLVHVVRQAKTILTQRPKTLAGQQLLELVRQLPGVRTKRQRRRWLRAYRYWLRRHEHFLKQRTYHPNKARRWWYTHRKLRAVRSLLNNSLPGLFLYVRYPQIPRSTNAIEGGINSPLKDLYRRHRGLSLEHKTTLTAWYLLSRQNGGKPTRDFL
ncbi:MAG: transposase [Gammaproteobacteria bacterium]